MIISINLDIAVGMSKTSIKKYTILVDNAVPIRDIVIYDMNLRLIWSFFSKFFLRFRVNEVIIQHIPLIIFDGIIGSHNQFNIKNTLQSTIPPTAESIRYKKMCFASFFASSSISLLFSPSKMLLYISIHFWMNLSIINSLS